MGNRVFKEPYPIQRSNFSFQKQLGSGGLSNVYEDNTFVKVASNMKHAKFAVKKIKRK